MFDAVGLAQPVVWATSNILGQTQGPFCAMENPADVVDAIVTGMI